MIAFLVESTICITVSLICFYAFFSSSKHLLFNRIYLLAALMLSLSIPFLEIETPYATSLLDESHFNLNAAEAQVFTDNIENPKETSMSTGGFGFINMLVVVYGVGCLFMLLRYIKNLVGINNLIRHAEIIDHTSHKVALISRTTSPFSFMKFIFVNGDDYRKSKIDKVVWSHELAHVRQFHSLDILLIEMLLVVFYFNPLIWIYRKAIKLNHEYQADEIVIKSHPDVERYAHQLIQLSQSENTLLFQCSFNYLSTKKRIMMLTKTKNSNVLFGNKIVLATILLLTTASILSFKSIQSTAVLNDVSKKVIVIDLGHGGIDTGAKSSGQVNEVDIINAIGAKIKAFDAHSRFLFTRSSDNLSLEDRTKFAASHNADLMVSIHIGSSENTQSNGIEVFYSDKSTQAEKSKHISEEFANKLKFRKGGSANAVKTANFVVLRNDQCPTVMLSLGFISNEEDLSYLSTEINQENLAKQIVTLLNEVK